MLKRNNQIAARILALRRINSSLQICNEISQNRYKNVTLISFARHKEGMEPDAILNRVLEGHAEGMRKLSGIGAKRYLFGEAWKIAKEREYFLGMTGLRGIGKTVLLLQLAKETGGIYFSADDRNLSGAAVYDIIKALSDAGHKSIFIDEIHAKPGWDADLKTAYDEALAYVAFTGSSAIGIRTLKSDLSRRMVLERLRPASFREWLSIRKGVEIPAQSMQQILDRKASLAREHGHNAQFLAEYFSTGGTLYPAKAQFHKTVISSIETIAYKDFASVKSVEADTAENFFRLLQLVASSMPMELSYSSIGEVLGKNKVWVMRFLAGVERTEAIKRVYPCGEGKKPFRKEAKYYLPFPYRSALCSMLVKEPNAGSLREEFFVNHAECCYVRTGSLPSADFKSQGKVFEIGGAGKQGKWGCDYVVVDGLSTAGNKVPLSLFGLLY